ncbi:helix-turn-helix domain-containing protein [Elizabethkingia anophelis]|uniref:helix-turn-helix domain-containing protein n=1 Tax=Elizabethkingia anophelis TaxID=1117645 RepID=UPI000C99B2FC|nr:helix-turn-helix domain-containing protein [Elizabethkingia anophelis]MCT3692625.1 helix-turn-helix domain-containing protein [Elizabethkingia anophelis]MCT3760549.1 helix-turn-helix domain-containing protein [Elizabethkingia anophelis]MCT3824091.1 helix-turn-helix domain-containing protein [Elizabethkingia anophelis]MCT3932338.1 helix-turn-helix domain-containing protein [Elizabethkingia anophelis]MCT3975185.1 helix-turn-helix domain-containing protein [Elizabethkingia anophelis]
MRKKLIFLCFYFSSLNFYFTQTLKKFKIPDTLQNKSFEQLEKSFGKNFETNDALLYANTFIIKAKQEKNTKRIIDGYFLFFLKSGEDVSYIDSIKTTMKDNNVNNLSYGYFKCGDIYYNTRDYRRSLSSYLSALEYAKKSEDKKSVVLIKNAIGDIKYTTNDYEEALNIFRQNYDYIKTKEKQDPNNYLSILFSLTNTYNATKKYDSAYMYGNIGKSKCLLYDKKYYFKMFDLSVHISEYYLGNYNKSITGLKNNIEFFKKNSINNLQISYMYLSMNYKILNDKDRYLYYFNKLDSLQKVTNHTDKILIELYEKSLNYYKEIGNKDEQLYLVNRLIDLNKTIYESKYNFSKEIHQKYDTPELIEEKEKLISDLKVRNTLLYWWLGGGLLLLFLFIYLYSINRKKMKLYKLHAQKLINIRKDDQNILKSTIIESENQLPITIDKPSFQKPEQNIDSIESKTQIPTSVKQAIIIKLQNFENEKKFTAQNITLYSLARDFETNRDYLSKMINELKEKNFSQYLNELRINFAIEELKDNRKLRLKTIAAIASDMGFSNAESFTRAFKYVTGTLPSYYIKALRENNTN